ncbi:unnamed protein product, partial [Rotaria sordida]
MSISLKLQLIVKIYDGIITNFYFIYILLQY